MEGWKIIHKQGAKIVLMQLFYFGRGYAECVGWLETPCLEIKTDKSSNVTFVNVTILIGPWLYQARVPSDKACVGLVWTTVILS